MATELISGAALSGFTVVVGALPGNSTCNSAQTATSNPCGVPASPETVVTTSANGAFSISVPAAGTYMLTIAKDSTYATLHRAVTVGAGSIVLGTVKIAALSSDEQAWVVDVNQQRATVSFPASFPNLVVDEYAEEQARAEVTAIVTGVQPYGDATEGIFAMAYLAEPGALYGVNSVADLVAAPSAFLKADAAWMTGEKSNCPNGNWQSCTVAANTGHYINISTTKDVWIGVGESTASFNDPPYGNEWAYAMLLPAGP